MMLLSLPYSLFSAPPETENTKKKPFHTNAIEFSYGRYEIGDPRYKSVYETGREIYGIELYQHLVSLSAHSFGLTAGIRRFVKKGKSTLMAEGTQLTLTPLNFGLRYVLRAKAFVPWMELGLGRVRYEEISELRSTEGSAFALHLQAGCFFEMPGWKPLKLKIYVRHTQATAREASIEVGLGGWEYGIGIALGFDLF